MSRLTRRVALHAQPQAAGNYDPDATAYFAAMSVQPTTARKDAINTLILALKAAGVWATYDLFYIGASHDRQAAQVNAKSPSTYMLSSVNSPPFVVDRYIGSQVGGGYWNTNWNPSTIPDANRNMKSSGPNPSQSFGIWSMQNATSGSSSVGAYQDGNVGGFTLAPLTGGTDAAFRCQSTGGNGSTGTATSLGLFNVRRGATDLITLKKNKDAFIGNSQPLQPAPNQTFRFGNIQGTTGQAMQAAFAFVGGFKTDAQCDAEYDAMRNYLVTIGAL